MIASVAELLIAPDRQRNEYRRQHHGRIVTSGQYAALSKIVMSGVFEEEGGDPFEEIEFGLERIMDGVQALIDRAPP